MSSTDSPTELRARIREALLGSTNADEESYIDTKAKFLIDDVIALITEETRKARIDELIHAELAMAGNDESEGIEYRVDRLKELGAGAGI